MTLNVPRCLSTVSKKYQQVLRNNDKPCQLENSYNPDSNQGFSLFQCERPKAEDAIEKMAEFFWKIIDEEDEENPYGDNQNKDNDEQ